MNTTHDLHVIRDATRGGVGTVYTRLQDRAMLEYGWMQRKFR